MEFRQVFKIWVLFGFIIFIFGCAIDSDILSLLQKYVAAPKAYPSSTVFSTNITVTLSCATTGATILLRTNTAMQWVETNKIQLKNTATIYAKAQKSGFFDSKVSTNRYTFTNLNDLKSPSVQILSPTNGQIFTNGSVPLTVKATDPEKHLNAVYIRLNSGGFKIIGNAEDISTNLYLSPGSNTLFVYASDTSGNCSATNVLVLARVCSWKSIGSESGINSDPASLLSIGFAKTGECYVAYRATDSPLNINVVKFNGTGWEYVGPPDFVDIMNEAVMAVSPDGIPYVIHNRTVYPAVFKYNNIGSPIWTNAGNNLPSGIIALNITFSLDGTPYIGYRNGTSDLIVKKLENNSWADVGTSGLVISYSGVNFFSLAISPTSVPYAVFNTSKINVRKYDPFSGWVAVGNSDFSVGLVSSTKIAFSPDGTPYIIFTDNNKSKMMRLSGSVWTNVGPAISTGISTYNALAISPTGDLYCAFCDNGQSDKAIVYCWNGTSWASMGAVSSGTATFTVLSFSPQGDLYIAFLDSVNGNKITVKAYK